MKIINRKARYNYELFEKIEAGIVLSGPEVKSAKEGRIKLDDAFVRIDKNNEVWLVNSHIAPYAFSLNKNYNPSRSRKLLLHKKEILSLQKKAEAKKLSLVPSACYLKKNKIKVEISLAKSKKKWQKKEALKKKDLLREMERELKI